MAVPVAEFGPPAILNHNNLLGLTVRHLLPPLNPFHLVGSSDMAAKPPVTTSGK